MKAGKVLAGIGGTIAVAMVITTLVLPGRSQQESTVLRFLTSLASGTIKTAEGR